MSHKSFRPIGSDYKTLLRSLPSVVPREVTDGLENIRRRIGRKIRIKWKEVGSNTRMERSLKKREIIS